MPWLVTVSGWGARGISVLSRLLLMVWLLAYLGKDHYALFAVILSLEGWLILTDGGLGASAQNRISEARANGISQEHLYRSIAQLALLFFFFFIALIGIFTPLINQFLFEHLSCTEVSLEGLIVAIISYCLLALGTVAYRALYAEQRGYWVHVLQMIAALCVLISTRLVINFYQGEHKLFWVALSALFVPGAVALGSFIWTFRKIRLFSRWDVEEIQRLFLPACRFLFFGFLAIAVLGIDYLVLARYATSDEIIVYHLLSRFFMGFFVMHGSFMQAMWPVCSEMLAREEKDRAKRLLYKSCLYGVLFVVGVTAFIALFSQAICSLFFSQYDVTLPLSAIILFGCYYVFRALCDPYAMALQSMNRLNPLLTTVPLQALVALGTQPFFFHYFGIQGIILGLICSYLCTVSWVLPLAFHRRVRAA